MSAGRDSRDGEALEFVLRTLPAMEHDAFVRDMEADPVLRRTVREWEDRLSRLVEARHGADVPSTLWDRIERATADRPSLDAVVLPFRSDRILRSRARWRAAAIGAGSLAAALALALGLDRWGAAVPGPGRTAPLIAVVNRSGELPALIVRVDPTGRTVQVRAVASETPPDRSLELWLVTAGAAPRSLGLVGQAGARLGLPAVGASSVSGATLAVSVEPTGGSTTGLPTGPVVYSGRLIPEEP